MRKLDLTNQVFGKFTAIRLDHMEGGRARWLCRCECGEERIIGAASLRSGNSTSCGSCSKLGNVRARKHGYSPKGPRTLIYNTWQSIKKRCNDPNSNGYKYWGGAGVKFHGPWNDNFEIFRKEVFASIGDRPAGMTIDRINPTGNYEPGNIRWATPLQQRHNRRP